MFYFWHGGSGTREDWILGLVTSIAFNLYLKKVNSEEVKGNHLFKLSIIIFLIFLLENFAINHGNQSHLIKYNFRSSFVSKFSISSFNNVIIYQIFKRANYTAHFS